VRGHWLIEDRPHWVRDMDRDEERSHVRTGNGPRVMAYLRNLAITILRLAGETSIGAAWRHHARPLGRLRLPGSLDKPARRHHKDERHNYKGNSPGTNEYRSESFHHATYRDCLHLPAESTPCQTHTRDFGLFRPG